jgi:hypothetical protein
MNYLALSDQLRLIQITGATLPDLRIDGELLIDALSALGSIRLDDSDVPYGPALPLTPADSRKQQGNKTDWCPSEAIWNQVMNVHAVCVGEELSRV